MRCVCIVMLKKILINIFNVAAGKFYVPVINSVTVILLY